MKRLPQALKGLEKYSQFILYRVIPSQKRPGKTDKITVDYKTGLNVNPYTPGVQTDFTTLANILPAFSDDFRIGFILSEDDPFFFLDIDDCLILEKDKSEWNKIAKEVCSTFSGAAIEISTSMRGLHIIGKYAKNIPHACRDQKKLNLELYTKKRLIALTGISAVGDVNFECTDKLENLIQDYFTAQISEIIKKENIWNLTPRPDWTGATDDRELIKRALSQISCRSIFDSTTATFQDLWENNSNRLAVAYPPKSSGQIYDSSAADLALASHLAFWTGQHHERIKNLMMQSFLVREKWNRYGYLRETIQKACCRQIEVFKKEIAAQAAPVLPSSRYRATTLADYVPAQISTVTGKTLISVDNLEKIFEGCVYICDIHKIWVPSGFTLSPDQFRVMYGGYTFAMDFSNEKFTSDAFKAFTQSQAKRFPKVDSSCFFTDQPPGAILVENKKRVVNTWWPIETKKVYGDISPFLNHLRKMLPVEQDQKILLSYMAAVVQYPGKKFDWCPVIQGVEGNGKSVLSLCLVEALGYNYAKTVPLSDFSERFNAFLYKSLFVWIDDVGPCKSKIEAIESLKTKITATFTKIEPKGKDQTFEKIYCNFMLNSNHKDCVQKAQNERRFAIFYTAQQKKSDLAACGMTQKYLSALESWFKQDGFAIVNQFLCDFEIPDEFNPTGVCKHAPATSSINEVELINTDFVEIELREVIEQDTPGFRGGWVSSVMLDNWLVSVKLDKKINRRQRSILLENMGYIVHPGLTDGRTNTKVMPDGAKPRLYIHKDSGLQDIRKDIAKEYADAQVKN